MSGKKRAAQVDVRQRMLILARLVYEGRQITSEWIARHFDITGSSARADLRNLAMYLPCDQAREPRIGKGNVYKTVQLATRLRRFQR